MQKLDDEIIKKIQASDVEASDREIARKLGISHNAVGKYRKQLGEALTKKKDKEGERKLKLLEHYSEKDIKEMLNYIATQTKKEIEKTIGEPGRLRFGLIADTHIGAREARIDALHKFYEDAKAEGVECVLHAGDLVDGGNVYSGQQFEQSENGYGAQVDKIVKDYPNIGVPTYYIGGNHDFSYLKTIGADVNRAISLLRSDLINLGYYDATINLNGIKIELVHGGGGTSYSPDYKLLRYIDSIPVGQEPDIFALGHYHRAIHSLHRGIHGFMPGAFLGPNMLAKRFKFPNTIGGWIIDITKDEEGKKKLTATFLEE